MPRKITESGRFLPYVFDMGCLNLIHHESPFQVKRFKTSTASLPIFEHQNLAWKNLKKTITNQLNKLNKSNLPIIVNELFKHNIIRDDRI
ncbi:unnamed protein product [Adineta steineri]|uniref:Uncharacterized protein n=1 Tax=Adineta steineri TaxID=433720 RepID=A0A814LA99_9BILA|nr:unnamed protein product [Adineta steineri]CAF1168888.1 unnamed protein product [Adineta steineri]